MYCDIILMLRAFASLFRPFLFIHLKILGFVQFFYLRTTLPLCTFNMNIFSWNITLFTGLNMSDDSKDIDVNEAFENLLLAEDLAGQESYEEGFTSGKNQMVEGYHLGYHRASALAAQLGYYYGVLIHIQQTFDTHKVADQLETLIENIQKFPVDNDDAVDIFDKFESIKFNFKKICSLVKIDFTYPESNKLEF
jgi:hypothetical protein